MPDPKSAEELALEMFRDEVQCTRIIRRMAEKAEACGDDLLAHERSTSANNSRLSVSRLANIIRAIRAEKEEAEKVPSHRRVDSTILRAGDYQATVYFCDICSGYHKLGHHYPLWDVWLDDGDSTQQNGHMTVIAEDAKSAAEEWARETYGIDENEFTETGGVAVLVALHEHRNNDDVPTFRYWVRGMIRVQYYAKEITDE